MKLARIESFRSTASMAAEHLKLEYYRNEMWHMPQFCEWPLYPFCMEESKRQLPTWFQEENCRFMIVAFLLSGQKNYRFAGKDYLLAPGHILVIPQGSSYYFETVRPDCHYHKVVLEFKGAHLLSIAEALRLNTFQLLTPEAMDYFVATAYELGDLLHRQREEDIPELVGKSCQFLHRLALLGHQGGGRSHLLSLAQAKLESNLARRLTTDDVAAALGVSRATLNRLFREELNVSPKKYRLMRKLEQASHLLEDTSLSIKEIAYTLGYCNQFHFCSEFRRFTRLTPTQFRLERRREPADGLSNN